MPASPERPASLTRYLLDGEQVVTAVHQHWAKIAEPIASALAGAVLAFWVDSHVSAALGLLATLLWWLWFALVARLVYRLAEWRHDWFVATDRRLLLFSGLVTRKVSMMPLVKVTDMSYERSVAGRLLGFGRFVMESAGHDQALRVVDWVPGPDLHYRAICAEIFGPSPRIDPQDDTRAYFDAPFDTGSGTAADGGFDDVGAGATGWVYRSPDRVRDPSADTGPIEIWPGRGRPGRRGRRDA